MVKKILIGLVSLLIIGLVTLFIFSRQNKPVYSGSLVLEHLEEEVTVYFDDMGVPHIYAQNQKDAYLALGYVHAQDRLWQMELMRRIAPGRLSEIFGEDLVSTDKLFKGLGIAEASQKAIDKLDKNSASYQLAKAYIDGVNQYITHGKTPVEFSILGIEKELYTINDIYHVFGYMAFGFAQAHKTDPLLTALRDKLGPEYISDLDIDISPRTTLIKNYRRNGMWPKKVTAQLSKIMDEMPVASFIGSNSWVVGPKKTESGKVILANDPHIGYSQPAVWYQAHISTPDYEMYGFHLALCPFPLLGHNYDYAYGITMLENDDIDFFYEDPDQEFANRRDTVFVKGEDPVEVTFRDASKGVIVNDLFDQLDEERPVSMKWIYTELDNQLLDVSYEMSHAKNIYDFREGAAKVHAPGLNLMYGDARGNVAWFGAAKLYTLEEGIESKFIRDPQQESDQPATYVDFSLNPQAINPRWGYVYSANNQPEAVEENYYPGYYLPEDRAKRIVDWMDSKEKFTLEDMEAMSVDITSAVSPELVGLLYDNISKVKLTDVEKQALEILRDWDGTYQKDLVAPTIYFKLIYQFLYHTFADEMGEELFDQFLKTHLCKRQIAKQLKWNRSPWFDDVNTKELKELKDEIITRAFHQSIAELEEQFGGNIDNWQWKKAVKVTHKHAFDKSGLLRSFFNVGPFETDGGNEVINNQLFRLNGSGLYEVHAGPSTRRVIDFADIEHARVIIPTGQSGNVFSKHYKDQASEYLNGSFRVMKLNKEEIKKSKDRLIFEKKIDSLN